MMRDRKRHANAADAQKAPENAPASPPAAEPAEHAELSAGSEARAPAGEQAAGAAPEAPAAAEARRTPEEELKDKYLRLAADFDNYRKRMQRELSLAQERTIDGVLRDVIAVADDLDRAMASAEKHGGAPAIVDGFRLVNARLTGALARYGVREIATEGRAFDPAMHEAVAHLPSDSAPEGAIVACTRKGYLRGENLLRAAQAVVSSGPPAPPAAAPETPDRNNVAEG